MCVCAVGSSGAVSTFVYNVVVTLLYPVYILCFCVTLAYIIYHKYFKTIIRRWSFVYLKKYL